MTDQLSLTYTYCWFEVWLPLPRFLFVVVVIRFEAHSPGLRVGSGKATGAGAINSRLAFWCPDLKTIDAAGDHHWIANADLCVISEIVFDSDPALLVELHVLGRRGDRAQLVERRVVVIHSRGHRQQLRFKDLCWHDGDALTPAFG